MKDVNTQYIGYMIKINLIDEHDITQIGDNTKYKCCLFLKNKLAREYKTNHNICCINLVIVEIYACIYSSIKFCYREFWVPSI